MRYRAFISYSHADEKAAGWLHRQLEGWRVPARMRAERPGLPARLAPVFRDREELGSAGELGPQIQAALAESDALIVLCSPEAARSRWVEQEVRTFRAGPRGERVFALIVAGEPGSGDERECFPPALRETEPLAADLRPGKDGKDLALLKLISGLLDVPLDTLRQREARRRHQRMLAITSLALVVMLVTSVLAVQAHIARQAAERRQKQAETLVDFMLGDLTEKLSEVSRLDILEGVHDHAMDYFQSLPADDVTDAALEQRARALMRIGNVRQEQGKLDKALESYRAAAVLSATLARAAPANVDRQKLHADVLAFTGTVHWYRGELDQAQAGFDAARDVLVRAQAHAPGDATLLFQLSTFENNAGHVLEGRGSNMEATAYYERMLALAKKLVETAPDYVYGPAQLGLAHNNLAKMALLRGDLAAAISGYRADVAIQARLAKADPRDNSQAERLLLSEAALGRTLALAGSLDEGAATLQKAFDDAIRLHGIEPDSASFHEDVALYGTQLARLRRLQGDAPAAAAASAASRAAFDALLQQQPEHPGWQRGLAEARVELAEQALQGSRLPEARSSLQQALSVLEPQLAAAPGDRAALLAMLGARLRLAEAGTDDARPAPLAAALAAADAQAGSRLDPRVGALRAELLFALGRDAEARALAQKLWSGGYRDAAFVQAMARHGLRLAPASNTAVATH